MRAVTLQPGVALVLALLCFGVGGWTAFQGLQVVREASASQNWPTTTGVVLASRIQTQTVRRPVYRRRPSGRVYDTGRTREYTLYSNAIAYEYEVNGKTHTGNNVQYGRRQGSALLDLLDFSQLLVTSSVLSKYPRGEEVTVYYNPDQPETAVLEPGAGWVSWIPVLLGGFIALLGYPFFSVYRHRE